MLLMTSGWALAAEPAAQNTGEKLAWKAGEKGAQGFWHQWPDKIYDGAIHFTAKEVAPTPEGFTFRPNNVYAECAYKATRLSSAPNKNIPGDLDATKQMLFANTFPMDKLPEMKTKGQQFHLDAEISGIKEDGGAFTAVFHFANEDVTCKVERTEYKVTATPVPDIRDLRYGPNFRQTIDIYQAKSDTPTPLVVSIHGGGWGALDKSALQIYIPPLLANGISVASINYRYCIKGQDNLEPPVAAPLLDAARAIQFLRSKAKELNIDKDRIAATGGSAGAFSSLWLAFHKDLADPGSDDPVARESSRLQCVGGTAAQTSLDPRQMAEWLPGIGYGPHAFGVNGGAGKTPDMVFQEFIDRRDEWLAKGYIQEFSPWALVTRDAPPTYLEYPGSPLDPKPGETGWQTHSPRFGFQLKKKMDELGVECHLTYEGVKDPEFGSMAEFFIKKLKEPSAAPSNQPKPDKTP